MLAIGPRIVMSFQLSMAVVQIAALHKKKQFQYARFFPELDSQLLRCPGCLLALSLSGL